MITRISVHATRGQKIAASVFGIFFLGILAGVVGVGALVASAFFAVDAETGLSDSIDNGGILYGGAVLFAAFFALIAMIAAAAVVTFLLQTFRSRATLSGSTLELTGALSTRRADLASAPVRIDTVPEYVRDPHDRVVPTGRRIPRLIAVDPSGRPVRLRLHGRDRGLLPSAELNALADAIESGTRPEPDAAHATQTAAILRRLATDPLARLI
ncbi:hypothetical protein GCM10023194_00970 [Planotetraspora phitsanulokensis]|uniref:Uncharacterized protein n=1 Tax=Planotetraspora phitsanulokensis TaxID=575192 RepID=A0A8J3XGI0_9ACTN|nr:hypothetical protein [Planotetraspora phitsanulokensis]GII40129.1 hypothetical protein Pph01_51320 [Planotetraspora phitsanulokensis]